jgi:hypothetical protein
MLLVHDDTSDTIQVVLSIIRTRPPEIYKTDHYVSLEMLITVCFVHRIEIKTPLEDDTHNEDKYLESLSASMMLESNTHNIYNTL